MDFQWWLVDPTITKFMIRSYSRDRTNLWSTIFTFQVEEVARRLAMVPEEGAALPVYFLSYLQSYLMIKNANPIPQSEIEDKPIDASNLNTFEILHRAR